MASIANTDWPTIGAFWASTAICVITIAATIINYLLFRSQVDPKVIVYADTDTARPTCILIKIENIGKGMAHNVSFKLSDAIPARAFGLTPDNAPQPPIMGDGLLIHGIPALGPESSRIILWGQYGGLKKSIEDKTISIACKYYRDAWRGKKAITEQFLLEIQSFEATDATDPDGARQSAKQLKRIADALNNAGNGFHPLTVRHISKSYKPSDPIQVQIKLPPRRLLSRGYNKIRITKAGHR